jgi:hypothetical protein
MKMKARRIIPGILNPPQIGSKNGSKYNDGLGTSMPPNFDLVYIYFEQKGEPDWAYQFFEAQELRRWKVETGRPVMNWKVAAIDWIFNQLQDRKRRFRQSPFYNESV